MSYPKRCDRCEQFGEWCFCEPAPLVETVGDKLDLFVPEMWAKEGTRILEEAMVISKFIYSEFEDEAAGLDKVRINRGIS